MNKVCLLEKYFSTIMPIFNLIPKIGLVELYNRNLIFINAKAVYSVDNNFYKITIVYFLRLIYSTTSIT